MKKEAGLTCRDCIHYEKCNNEYYKDNIKYVEDKLIFMGNQRPCIYFQDRNLFVKLPCKVGEKVYDIRWWDNKKEKCTDSKGNAFYRTVQKYKVTKREFSPFSLDYAQFGKEVFLTKEEAEKALKEKNKQV